MFRLSGLNVARKLVDASLFWEREKLSHNLMSNATIVMTMDVARR